MGFPDWFVRTHLFRLLWNLLFGVGCGRKMTKTTAFDFESDHLSNEGEQEAFGWLVHARRVLSPLRQSSSLVAKAVAAPSPGAALLEPQCRGASWLLPLCPWLVCHLRDTPSLHLHRAWGLDAGRWIAGYLTMIQMDTTKNTPLPPFFFLANVTAKPIFMRAGEERIESDSWWSC